MDSTVVPAAGHNDVQFDIAGVNSAWGPTLGTAGGRIRRTIEPGVTVEGDAGVLDVLNGGSGPSRVAYTGRLGAMWKSDPASHLAVLAGAGGGYHAAAGTWGAFDIGAAISGHHRLVRPTLAADVGYSAPFYHRTFVVMDTDNTPSTLRLPRNFTTAMSAGIEIGRPEMTFVAGLSFAQFWLLDSSTVDRDTRTIRGDAFYAMLGLGVRVTTD